MRPAPKQSLLQSVLMGPPTSPVLSEQPECMWGECSSHHSKSQGPDVTGLKQGHFSSPINHTLVAATAITACGLILVLFLSTLFPRLSAFLCSLNFNLLLLPLELSTSLLWDVKSYSIKLGLLDPDSGIISLHSDDQYCHLWFLSWPLSTLWVIVKPLGLMWAEKSCGLLYRRTCLIRWGWSTNVREEGTLWKTRWWRAWSDRLQKQDVASATQPPTTTAATTHYPTHKHEQHTHHNQSLATDLP